MSNDLQVQKVQILPRITNSGKTDKENEKIGIEITVKNNSRSIKYNLFASLRRVFYDSVTHTLFLILSDNENVFEQLRTKIWGQVPKKMRIDTDRTVPSLIALLPNESRILKVSVPVIIRRLARLPAPRKIEVSDISSLEKIECIISYAPAPISIKSKKQVPLELESWQVVRGLTAAKLPEKGPGVTEL